MSAYYSIIPRQIIERAPVSELAFFVIGFSIISKPFPWLC